MYIFSGCLILGSAVKVMPKKESASVGLRLIYEEAHDTAVSRGYRTKQSTVIAVNYRFSINSKKLLVLKFYEKYNYLDGSKMKNYHISWSESSIDLSLCITIYNSIFIRLSKELNYVNKY